MTAANSETAGWTGRAIERLEDAALLTGRGRYADDLGVRPGTLHAAILRSPHAHARITGIDTAAALSRPGVTAVLTGAHLRDWAQPFVVGVKQPMEHWALAMDRVRYVGEPVAIVLAEDRYAAEDALEAVEVAYEPLPHVTDPEEAATTGAPVLHDKVGANVVSDRRFHYGDPEGAFAAAAHHVTMTTRYPRNSCTPIEGYVVVADWAAADGGYDVMANFQGPFALHPVMALALKVPANRLRLRTPPDSGGSYGVKQGVFQYIVALCLAARLAGRPVKWVEDKVEHLTAATSATNRVVTLEAAADADGVVTALRYDQLDDCGAYLRAPEPATIYRMHGNMTGAYRIPNLEIRDRVVLTNKTPTGLVRGFGGPQVYFALERMMAKVAEVTGLDPLEVIRRNLVPADRFPYRTPSGGVLDSGDYAKGLERAVADGGLDELLRRREAARAEGRAYGIGYAAVVEPSISNMGYITTVLTPEERRKAGPKGGAVASASVQVDPLGSVTVHVSSTHQGQGHRTVLSQVVADALGLKPADIRVALDLDTGKDPWSVASGNYSSRFGGAVAGTAHKAATRLRDRLAAVAAEQLGGAAEDVVFAGGRVFSKADPDRTLPFHRVAATCHWSQGTRDPDADPVIRETVFWSPEVLKAPTEADEINSSACHGFIFDFCGVEVDRATGRVRVDKYVTLHDAGTLLNPALVNGQILGGFAHAVGAALYERFAYGADGGFLTGTFADYPVPTACEVPTPTILHMETPSPVTPLGAKGVGEGNCMSTPVCLANAVAEALGVEDVELPLTPDRVHALLGLTEPPQPERARRTTDLTLSRESYALEGFGETRVPCTPDVLWAYLLDPETLAKVVPGCKSLEVTGENAYRGEVALGVGVVKGVFTATVKLSDLEPPRFLRLSGGAAGPLGASEGEGALALEPVGAETIVRYRYGVDLSGRVASVGGRMLDGAARALIRQFLERLVAQAAPDHAGRQAGSGGRGHRPSWIARLLKALGLGGQS